MTIAISLLLLSIASSTYADSATWKTNPATSDWNHAGNWTPPTVPNGPSDTAIFATSNTTGVSLSAFTKVNSIVFNPGASAFTITASPGSILTLSGVGITNNSGVAQNFATAVSGVTFQIGQIQFTNSATAGTSTIFTNDAGTASGQISGEMRFLDTSTAGNGAFTNNGGAVSGTSGGVIFFGDGSTSGNGSFTNNGGAVRGATGGGIEFDNFSSAGNAVITSNGGAVSDAVGGGTDFRQRATAANATLTANGGLNGGGGSSIVFYEISKGGKARVEVFGNGTVDLTNGILDIGPHNAPGVTIGSLEGTGAVSLGANNLTVGSNNLNTTFSGVIQDFGPVGGSLTKIGSGKLSLNNSNTYTGGTTINRGKLLVNNTSGSGTGTGPVQVNGGRLGGNGTISGAVTVGNGSGRGAVLSPGNRLDSSATLTIQNTLTFNADATYDFSLRSHAGTADEAVAMGVTINSGAQFSFDDLGNTTLAPGIVFTVINNTAATPISGTFTNLPDGSIFISNGNTYQVSYEGGDGNDLTLTVVP